MVNPVEIRRECTANMIHFNAVDPPPQPKALPKASPMVRPFNLKVPINNKVADPACCCGERVVRLMTRRETVWKREEHEQGRR
jgi:hypothetical protein